MLMLLPSWLRMGTRIASRHKYSVGVGLPRHKKARGGGMEWRWGGGHQGNQEKIFCRFLTRSCLSLCCCICSVCLTRTRRFGGSTGTFREPPAISAIPTAWIARLSQTWIKSCTFYGEGQSQSSRMLPELRVLSGGHIIDLIHQDTSCTLIPIMKA
jgi:hypothetical protein